MRHSWFAAILSSIFLPSSIFAWGLPSLPKARVETAPKIPSPYQQCVKPLQDQAKEYLFLCAEQEFWYGFSDGRLKVRQEVEAVLGKIMSLTNDSTDGPKRGRLFALRGYLRLAMALENAKMEYMIFGSLEKDFQDAKKLDTEDKVYDTFLDTIVMAKAAAFGNWKKATELALPAFDILKDQPTNILALSGTTIGFPMDTGLPQKTIKFLDEWTCPGRVQGPNVCSAQAPRNPACRFPAPGSSILDLRHS
jgi:hypothetical protein